MNVTGAHWFLFLFLLAIHGTSCAVNLEPWYPRTYEINPFVTGITQLSTCVQSPHGNFERGLHANYLNCGVYAAAYEFGAELDLSLAESSIRSFGFDSFSCTGRYQLWDDVALVDPVSVIASISLKAATQTALNDIASFHHGKFETMMHVSVGKEFPCAQFWLSRFWGAVGLGIADVGSPWWHFYLCAEKNAFDKHKWKIFIDSLIGCGGESLSHCKKFHGYGPIAHRSVDLGVEYSYSFDFGLNASLGYFYRIYAQNFPKNTNSIAVTLLYPFGL